MQQANNKTRPRETFYKALVQNTVLLLCLATMMNRKPKVVHVPPAVSNNSMRRRACKRKWHVYPPHFVNVNET